MKKELLEEIRKLSGITHSRPGLHEADQNPRHAEVQGLLNRIAQACKNELAKAGGQVLAKGVPLRRVAAPILVD